MKHKIIIITSLFLFPVIQATSNWSSSGTAKSDKNINFYGTLTTHQGQTESVDHILIEGKHGDIVMYDAPLKREPEVFNEKTKQTEIKLSENPTTDFVKSKIDLSAISSIKVPHPNTIWVYQKEEKYTRLEFTLVQITAKESNIPKEYLLEHKTRISCNSTDTQESQKKEVPLAAIDTLTIEGHSFSVETKKKQIKQEISTTCPVVKKETEITTEIEVK